VPLAGVIAGGVLVLGGAAAAVLLTMHPFSHGETISNAGSTSKASAHRSPSASTSAAIGAAAATATSTPSVSGSSPSASPASASPAATQATEQQAAANLAGMLSQSVSDRTAISQAFSDLTRCGPSLNQDPQVFESAASSRRTLLTELASMPGRSALPAPMLQDLTSAWQASIAADKDYAQWANNEITKGCVPNDTSDPGAVAANGPDTAATTDKQAFVNLWNQLATQYGLTTYQEGQL
jgi:hypothetical protein